MMKWPAGTESRILISAAHFGSAAILVRRTDDQHQLKVPTDTIVGWIRGNIDINIAVLA